MPVSAMAAGVSPCSVAQTDDGVVEIVQQSSLLNVANHAFDPEETGQPVATCHRQYLMQRRAG